VRTASPAATQRALAALADRRAGAYRPRRRSHPAGRPSTVVAGRPARCRRLWFGDAVPVLTRPVG